MATGEDTDRGKGLPAHTVDDCRFRDIIEFSRDGVWELDADGCTRYVNARMGEMIGRSTAEMQDVRLPDILAGDAASRLECAGGRWAEALLVMREVQILTVDGEPVWCRLNARLCRNGGEGRDGVILTFADISDLKWRERELAQYRERFEDTMRASGTGLWEWDVAQDRLAWDERCFTMLGYPAEGFTLSMDIMRELIHADDQLQIATEMAQACMSGQSFQAEVRVRHANGGWHWIATHGKVTETGPGGEPLKMLGIHRDINARRQALARSKRLTRRLELATSAAGVGIFEVDLHGGDVHWDRQMLALFGVEPGAGDLRQRWEGLIHEEDLKGVQQMAADVVRDGRTRESEYRIRADGTEEFRWIRSTATRAEREDGNGTCLLGTCVDVTREKQHAEVLRELAETDALTGLANRRLFNAALDADYVRFQRFGTPFVVLALDLDHFKPVNDTWGHDVGDEVLRNLARVLETCVRGSDVSARIGGEEFAVIMRGTTADNALEPARRLAEAIRAMTTRCPNGDTISVTASIGISEVNEQDEHPSDVVKRADKALYRAKEGGRDRVERDG